MASISDYAILTPPAQFTPDEVAVFRFQYNERLTDYYATLDVYGYEQSDNVHGTYTGTKMTHQLREGIGGQWYWEFEVPANTLGFIPNGGSDSYHYSGKMQAKVDVGGELDINGNVINPVITSNVVLVDMVVLDPTLINWLYTPYNTDCSRQRVSMDIGNIKTYGASGNDDVQSCRFWLYDSNKRLLRDSMELYEWDTNIQTNILYTYYDLKDDRTYYVRGRITLNGGKSFWCNDGAYCPITVHYADIPDSSENFTSSNIMGGVDLKLDLTGITYDRVVITRTEVNANEYIEVGTSELSGDIVEITDHYAIPKRDYLYQAVVYNGNAIVGTYYTRIQAKSSGITISDILGSYTAVANITKHPISRNDRGSILEAMDSKYPYHVMNGDPDYDSGQIDAMFTEVDDCVIDTDNAELSDIFRAWLNNGRAKLLTYYTGEAWIVTVSGIQTTDPNNTDVYNTTFNWTEIGNAFRISEYARLGLVTADG